jgi:hypothetical protein
MRELDGDEDDDLGEPDDTTEDVDDRERDIKDWKPDVDVTYKGANMLQKDARRCFNDLLGHASRFRYIFSPVSAHSRTVPTTRSVSIRSAHIPPILPLDIHRKRSFPVTANFRSRRRRHGIAFFLDVKIHSSRSICGP